MYTFNEVKIAYLRSNERVVRESVFFAPYAAVSAGTHEATVSLWSTGTAAATAAAELSVRLVVAGSPLYSVPDLDFGATSSRGDPCSDGWQAGEEIPGAPADLGQVKSEAHFGAQKRGQDRVGHHSRRSDLYGVS